MTGPQPRNGIMDLPPYVGGKESLPGQEKIFKISANENPLGASPNALEAYRMAGENLEIYPDGHSVDLREALAKAHKLDVNKIVCGFGSDELLQIMATAYLQPGDEAIHTEHGFLVYKLASQATGARPVSVAETNLTADVDAILDA
ncbi:MAG: histidinol-phosphate transaminase, partial [Pseudomonadota bacterium]|nr:histidinol-phosphate transaminase [Pseudomonadota bacterium]